MLTGRPSLWFLAVPALMALPTLPLTNRIHPLVFGIPFFLFWVLVCVVTTPGWIWLAHHFDPAARDEKGAE